MIAIKPTGLTWLCIQSQKEAIYRYVPGDEPDTWETPYMSGYGGQSRV